MTGPGSNLVAAATTAIAALAAAGGELLPAAPAGWVAAALLALLSAFSLWRAGSVRAWKETALARDARIGDLERELASLRAELKIPERIEGIISLMGDTAKRQEDAATARAERALERVEIQWEAHHDAAESRTARLLEQGKDHEIAAEARTQRLLDALRDIRTSQ